MVELMVAANGDKGRPAEILLVEDNPGDVVLTLKAFSSVKFVNNITVAEDAEKALAILRREPPHAGTTRPDLILLDINLPKIGGIFLLEEIRKDTKLMKIPVLMLTSSTAKSDIMSAYHLDANCYMVKPLTMEKLCLAVTKIPGFWNVLMVADS